MYLSLLRFFYLVLLRSSYCLVLHLTPQASLSISHRAVPVVMNALRFCLSGTVLISPSLLKVSFSRYKILDWVVCIFFLAFSLYQLIALWLPKFLMRTLLMILMEFPVCGKPLLSCCFEVLSFKSLILMWSCVLVRVSEFTLRGVHSAY
jgi:hypothetical protein